MTPDEQETIDKVTAALIGRLYVGARVTTHSGKQGTVISLREEGTWEWVRVKHAPDEYWEYLSFYLRLI